jgi:hypothetical protein
VTDDPVDTARGDSQVRTAETATASRAAFRMRSGCRVAASPAPRLAVWPLSLLAPQRTRKHLLGTG